MDLRALATQLVAGLTGRIGASAYDVAWLARVPAGDSAAPRWPALLDWLLEHQWADGSWGGAIPYFHDRALCTLAAIIALHEHGSNGAMARPIALGEQYIWNHLHFLNYDPIELVGFELILPTLLAQARGLGLDVPSHSYGYGDIRAAKLRLLPIEMFYEPGTSVAFSLEFLGQQGDRQRLARVQGAQGAIANSPATTAYLALQTGGNDLAWSYLEGVMARDTGVPAFFPFRTFEAAWVLEHLSFGGLDLRADGLAQSPAWQWLLSDLNESGVGIDPLFGIRDGDTTSVTINVLLLGGHSSGADALRRFEDPRERIFRTFPFERNASVATNAHALEALVNLPDYPDREEIRNRAVTMIFSERKFRSFWVDKWHASPYYATGHVLLALIQTGDPLLSECQYSIDWLEHTQRADGSWGFFGQGTVEETAYALLALLHFHRRVQPVALPVLQQGARYLFRMLEVASPRYPELWIAKTLYAPESIIRAAVLAAAILYEDTFGRAG